MSWASEYFGEEIVTKNGTVKTSEALAGKKRVALYFSAHWVSYDGIYYYIINA